MKSIVIHLCKKWDLWPRFGHADKERMAVYVRQDLPLPARLYIQAHELYHLEDPKERLREMRAAILPLILIPLGFILVICYSLWSRDRIELYAKKVKEWLK